VSYYIQSTIENYIYYYLLLVNISAAYNLYFVPHSKTHLFKIVCVITQLLHPCFKLVLSEFLCCTTQICFLEYYIVF
jgi:hypothetical protein